MSHGDGSVEEIREQTCKSMQWLYDASHWDVKWTSFLLERHEEGSWTYCLRVSSFGFPVSSSQCFTFLGIGLVSQPFAPQMASEGLSGGSSRMWGRVGTGGGQQPGWTLPLKPINYSKYGWADMMSCVISKSFQFYYNDLWYTLWLEDTLFYIILEGINNKQNTMATSDSLQCNKK